MKPLPSAELAHQQEVENALTKRSSASETKKRGRPRRSSIASAVRTREYRARKKAQETKDKPAESIYELKTWEQLLVENAELREQVKLLTKILGKAYEV